MDDAGKQQQQQQQPQIRIIDPSVFSERKRGLTCNVSAPAKRARAEEFLALNGYNQMAASPLFSYLDQAAAPVKLAGTNPGFLPQNRLPESGATSTSGRHDSSLQPVLSSSGDLVSLIYQQNLEIDAFICLQVSRSLLILLIFQSFCSVLMIILIDRRTRGC